LSSAFVAAPETEATSISDVIRLDVFLTSHLHARSFATAGSREHPTTRRERKSKPLYERAGRSGVVSNGVHPPVDV